VVSRNRNELVLGDFRQLLWCDVLHAWGAKRKSYRDLGSLVNSPGARFPALISVTAEANGSPPRKAGQARHRKPLRLFASNRRGGNPAHQLGNCRTSVGTVALLTPPLLYSRALLGAADGVLPGNWADR
jgi:hypothetical protein